MINNYFWKSISLLWAGILLLIYYLLISNDVTSIDWNQFGVVTAVKDQQPTRCPNVSWAFASVASIEGLMGIKEIARLSNTNHQELLQKPKSEYFKILEKYSQNYSQDNLSEQQILDCTPKQDNCFGGSLIDAYQFALDYGIVDYSLLYYVAQKQICPIDNKSESVFNITGYSVQSGCDNLKKLIFQQPVAVKINYSNLEDYISYDIDQDIISTNYCSQQQSQDAKYQYVLVTAYDGKTFTIKNSEGVNWGYQGYAKIDATTDNTCNICEEIYYPNQN
ncbi:hypothetical protein ABPG72_013034 [Tetrahymena utriculariae]